MPGLCWTCDLARIPHGLQLSGSTAMTSRHPSHAESGHSTDKQPPAAAPKLHVQRSLSKENITIHFSAFGTEEEEEEEELNCITVSTTSATQNDSNIVTALEASEEMFEAVPLDSADEVAVIPETSRLSPFSKHHTIGSPTQTLTSRIAEQKGSISSSSPTKSLSFPSSEKPFLSLVKSLSSEVSEIRDGVSSVPAPSVRHRHLMKSLVKSLSSDTSQDSSSSSTPYRLPESRLNLQLFKQFAQSRMPSATMSSAADSKTAPSSPLTSTDNRSFFKVSDVEARIEDTKRRFSEVISEPLQLLSKIMDEKSSSLVSGSLYRPKGLSVSASELSNITSINCHVESNNNNCIKEEEGGDWEDERVNSGASGPPESQVPSTVHTKSPNKPSLLSMSLENCSMSALAKQEDEDFCILYTEDFETCADTEGDGGDRTDDTGTGSQTKVLLSGSTEPCSEDESENTVPVPCVPHYTLIILTVLVYGYFVLPLPSYIGGMLLGTVFGFFLAIGVVWLTGPKPSGGFRRTRHHGKLWNLTKLDIKEPEIFKGWMNEILNYDPEMYHATLTHSVYVRLEGSIIRLSKPNHNIARRATHNEPKPDVNYISQKIYDLTNSKVYLMPQSLARKRVWNKKYPICIELGKQDDFMSKAEDDGLEANEGTGVRDRGESSGEAQERGSPPWSSRDLTLYLFGRTGREKEEWFQRFLSASKLKVDLKKTPSVTASKSVLKPFRCFLWPTALSSHSRSSSRSSLDEALIPQPRPKDLSVSSTAAGSAKTKPLLDYSVYMASLLPKRSTVSPPAASPALQSPQSSPGADKKSTTSAQVLHREEEEEEEAAAVAWVNAALGRVLWDFLVEPYWADLVSKKIQMKLSKIRLPYFMNELTLTELDMGSATPRILGASKPSIDYRGLWFDLELSYSGSFLMTLETKMNLIRLGKEGESFRLGEFGKDGYRPRTYCLADSDEESSSAGSSDEEDSSELSNDSAGAEGLVGGHKPSKIMRFVDKITKSKYFQKATETEFIKKKMEEVSNTPLLLTVEVQELQGTLVVNIPPPPTDRIWYGFRTPPHLELKARPKLGEREVTLPHVTDWIEKKLIQEFQDETDDDSAPQPHLALSGADENSPVATDSVQDNAAQVQVTFDLSNMSTSEDVEDQELPEDEDGEELILLDPEHLAEEKADTRLTLEMGFEMSVIQEQLARLHTRLEDHHQTKAQAEAKCRQAQDQLEEVKGHHSSTLDKHSKATASVSQLQVELDKLILHLDLTQGVSDDLRSNVKAMKNARCKAGTEKSQAEKQKLKQDLYVERLMKDLERLTQQIAMYEAQTSAQAEETQAAKQAHSEAEMEMESLVMVRRQLLQQWNSSLVGMRRRDEAFCALQEAVRTKEHQVILLDREIEGYKKSTTEEQERNETLTLQLNRFQMDAATSKTLISQKQAQYEALQAHYSTSLRILRETENTLVRLTKESNSHQAVANDQRRQLEKESTVRLELEDKILAHMQEKLTHHKAAKYSQRLTSKTAALKKEKISQLWQLENELVAVGLESSEVSQHLESLALTQEALDEEIAKLNKLLTSNQAKISSFIILIEQKQATIASYNRKISEIAASTGHEDLSPMQIKVEALMAQIEEMAVNIKSDQQLWMKRQGTLVGLTQDIQADRKNMLKLQKEYTVMQQKKIRLESQIEAEHQELTELGKNVKMLGGDLVQLNTLVSKKGQLSQALEQDNVLMEKDFLQRLKASRGC
ncbi:hypothetical protein F2P81_010774 [Scophthalmus maximus]|uniref:SMP-LTD domain-containing protein n=2 Tax=Scophthalmus maximus TaxID=52904 RepID=A0A6A4T1J7_SCOMX|nr:hypothetical protein F2P81_010774 [Scophthalmus maximus]